MENVNQVNNEDNKIQGEEKEPKETKFRYYKRVLSNLSFKRLSPVLNNAHERSGKNKVFIFFDMINCTLRYGAGYQDYVIFELWNLPHEKRKTYFTRFRSKKFVMFMNDPKQSHFFDNKNEFNVKFKDFIGRESVDLAVATREEIENFYNTRTKTFAKMNDLSCGIGCELLTNSNFESFEDYYKYVKEKGFGTLEDVIENHPKIAQLHPSSTNTLRVITLVDSKGEAHPVFAVFKMGRDGRVVDNYGLHGPVDLETGKFLYPAHSGDTTAGKHFTKHPNTGIELLGFEVPYFKEVLETAKKAALVVPEIRYVGWDIAVTPNGPAIIEGNNYCAHDFWQLPGQREDDLGIMPLINEIIPEMKW